MVSPTKRSITRDSSHSNFIVILNDNEMSIAPNVGSIASYLSVLRSKPLANFVREQAKDVFDHIPLGGTARKAFASRRDGGDALRFADRRRRPSFSKSLASATWDRSTATTST